MDVLDGDYKPHGIDLLFEGLKVDIKATGAIVVDVHITTEIFLALPTEVQLAIIKRFPSVKP